MSAFLCAHRASAVGRTAEKALVSAPRSRHPGVIALVLAASTLLAAPVARATDAVALVKDYLQGLNSLQAEFRQITLPSDGSDMIESRGTFYLLRPNRFRWDYTVPWSQQIVADGQRIYLYDEELAQVSHRSQKRVLDGTPAQLLASDQPPEDYFTMRNIDRGDQRDWAELVPKTEDTDVVRLQIGFVDGELDTLVMEDRFGQLTRFIFTELERNPQLQYAFFRFERPAGADFLQID
ncbi:outer membrane lipoprotein chaperone LolA [Thiohalocapsa marina]|uniref:Outer-membrane lipoprotein carrier protein n=1 Tax=Thiohalocapsa marina TaxID=424902 RepID=A0A5M8FKW5_9GAMM|nr:outer membrane lipoprotein chaperone LolA [Thiohalocapsa marina]KAA6184386.1 outer membrane lipoprotein chaperone LolA [Thiohalocapsa marina]